MKTSKIPAQQNAILGFLTTVVNEFGSFQLNVKSLLTYVMGTNVLVIIGNKRQGLGNSKMDVKESAIVCICYLYEQLGDVIKTMIDQGELNDLLKKKVMERIDAISYICMLCDY